LVIAIEHYFTVSTLELYASSHLFRNLEAIDGRCGGSGEEADQIVIILDAAIETKEQSLKDDKLTLLDLKLVMCQQFGIIGERRATR
jgi:hypothetical protein